MWPDVSSLVTTVRPLTLTASTPLLTNDNDILDYYLPAGHNPGWIVAPGLQSPAEIEAHTYRGVALDLSATLDSDTLPREAVSGDALTVSAEVLQLSAGSSELYAIVRALEKSSYYRITAVLPYNTSDSAKSTGLVVVWQRQIPVQRAVNHHRRARSATR